MMEFYFLGSIHRRETSKFYCYLLQLNFQKELIIVLWHKIPFLTKKSKQEKKRVYSTILQDTYTNK